MADQDKPLPKPPKQAFQKPAQEQSGQELLADLMAVAAAEGRLDEFLKENMPENEHAQELAKMMMGMTGMLPMGGMAAPMPPAQPSPETGTAAAVPENVLKAVQNGDVKGLMDMLRQEHQKRSPGSALVGTADAGQEQEAAALQPSGMPAIEKELVDAMIKIAKDNSVSADWIILRAIKVYVEEYRRTGKL
jgi:hypothetical protein